MFKSLHSRLLTIFILSFSIIIVILSGSFYLNQRSRLTTVIQQNSINLSEQYAQVISSTLNSHIAQLKAIAKAPQVRQLDKTYIFNRYSEIIESSELLFFTGGLLTRDGIMYDLNGTTNDVSDRQYYKDVFQSNVDYIISDAIIGKFRDIPVFVLAVPITHENEILGALVTPLKLTEVSTSINNINITENSFGWIIDDNGRLITHPNSEYVLQQNIHDGDDNGFIGLTDVGKEMMTQASGFGEYYDSNSNQNKILSYVTIPNSPKWRLGISIPTHEIFAPLNDLLITVVIFASFSLLLAIILATVFSKSIVKPIYSLTVAIDSMRTGQLNTIPHDNSGKEINKLIEVFNSMSTDLSTLSNNIEYQIGQRTKNLSEINISLKELAARDHLTKLYNRGALTDHIHAMMKSTDDGLITSFALIFIDLNNFKYYNDTFGHDTGDELLIECAHQIKKQFRDHDFVARYGGDEFVIILEDINSKTLNNLIIKLKQFSFLNKEFKNTVASLSQNKKIPNNKLLSFAVGYSVYQKSSDININQLISEADLNMYEHKSRVKSLLAPK